MFEIISRALRQNNVEQNDTIVINADEKKVITLNIPKILLILLYNFSMYCRTEDKVMFDFIMNNFNEILDIVRTELEIALYNYITLYEQELAEKIELHNKVETMLILTIQDKVNKKLEKLL